MIRSDASSMAGAPAQSMPARRSGWRGAVEVTKTTFKRFFAARADMLSGAVAYFTILSLAPLLMMAVAIVGIVFGEEAARQRVVEDLSTAMGPTGAEVLDQLLRASAIGGNGWKIAVSVLVAGWSASRIFLRLQDALNDIWGVRPKAARNLGSMAKHVLRKRAGSFFIAFLVGALLFASMAAQSVLAGFHKITGEVPFGRVLWPVLEGSAMILLVAVFLGLTYKSLPDVELRFRDVWLGALLTSLLAAVGSFAISAYLGYLATSSLAGAAGGVLVLLLWVYYNSQVFLLGAEFTRAHTEWRRGAVLPEPHAELVPMCEHSTRITNAPRR